MLQFLVHGRWAPLFVSRRRLEGETLHFPNSVLLAPASWSLQFLPLLPPLSLRTLPKACRGCFLKADVCSLPSTTKCLFRDKFSQLILKYCAACVFSFLVDNRPAMSSFNHRQTGPTSSFVFSPPVIPEHFCNNTKSHRITSLFKTFHCLLVIHTKTIDCRAWHLSISRCLLSLHYHCKYQTVVSIINTP